MLNECTRGTVIRGRSRAGAGIGPHSRAFVPASLPPHPLPGLSGERGRLHEQALLACGRLDAITALLPEPDLFLYAYVRKEALVSSQIEGTQSSLSDLLLFELEETPGVPFDDVVEVSNYIAALEHFLHDEQQPFSALIKAALAHVQFETIHPFLDRNGRMGRLLIALILHEDRVLHQPLLYLSLYFKQNREECYRLLAVFQEDRERVEATGRSAANALRVFHALGTRPVAPINDLSGRSGVAYPTASRAVETLEGLGVLREITGRRRAPCLRLFALYRGAQRGCGAPVEGGDYPDPGPVGCSSGWPCP